jgi:hypothetical protein
VCSLHLRPHGRSCLRGRCESLPEAGSRVFWWVQPNYCQYPLDIDVYVDIHVALYAPVNVARAASVQR